MKGVIMGNRVVIEENTIYEIDEECIKKMEKQKIAIEELKNKKVNQKENQINKARKQ
jgi:hypothetical protein